MVNSRVFRRSWCDELCTMSETFHLEYSNVTGMIDIIDRQDVFLFALKSQILQYQSSCYLLGEQNDARVTGS